MNNSLIEVMYYLIEINDRLIKSYKLNYILEIKNINIEM